MWTGKAKRLILASASPRRLQLLEQIKVPVEQLVVPVPGEDEPRLPNEAVTDYVTRTAHDKLARTLAHWQATYPDQPVPPMLAADTTVAMGEQILGKPVDTDDARRILQQLAGQTHDVYCAVVLWHEGTLLDALTCSQVTFDSNFNQAIEHYIATKEPFGKAGAYAIQGMAAAYIREVIGSYTGVVGLPLYETACLLRRAGLYR